MIRPSGVDFKQDLTQYVAKCIKLIHTPQMRDALIGILTGSDPVKRVARAVVLVMQRIDMASREAGIEVHDTVKAVASREVCANVIELGEAAGVIKKFDDDLLEFAHSVAVQDYIKAEIQGGRINQKKALIGIQADMRRLPPKQRAEVAKAQKRIQQTAKRYNGGVDNGTA